MKHRWIGPVLVALTTATFTGAQVPLDHGLRFSYNTIGVEDVDLGTGVATKLPGAVGWYASCWGGTIDPVTGELWTGGVTFSAPRLAKHTMSGPAITSTTIVALLDAGLSLRSIDFDRNGDIYTLNSGTIYQVDRATGTPTVWDVDSYAGEFIAMCISMETNTMYVGTFDNYYGASAIIEYDLGAGPGPGTVLFDPQALGYSGEVTGMDDAPGGLLFITTRGTYGDSLIAHDPPSGTTFLVNGAPSVGLADVWWDRKFGILHMVGDGFTDDYWTLDLTSGMATQITYGADIQSLGNVAVNDFTDRTEVFPQRPSASSAFTLETAAHGLPGKIAGTAVTAINGTLLPTPIQLGAGFCDSGGFLTHSVDVPAGLLSAGDVLQITSLRFLGGGTGLVIAPSVDVIFVP